MFLQIGETLYILCVYQIYSISPFGVAEAPVMPNRGKPGVISRRRVRSGFRLSGMLMVDLLPMLRLLIRRVCRLPRLGTDRRGCWGTPGPAKDVITGRHKHKGQLSIILTIRHIHSEHIIITPPPQHTSRLRLNWEVYFRLLHTTVSY